jgi:large subunit ribosomal protein L6
MSRVGKNPVKVPSGVTADLSGRKLTIKGKLGELSLKLSDQVQAKIEDGKVVFTPANDSKQARMMWGTARNLTRNMVAGVSQGFRKNLEINGVGYRAAIQGKTLQLQLGYSHDVNYPIPEDVTIKCEKPTSISISGRDKQRVGQVAAEIRAFRQPEPYKGKGIKYDDETILRKEGKKK